MGDEYKSNNLDNAATFEGNVNNGFTAANGLRQIWDNVTHTGMLGLPDRELGLNDLARPFGLNYDAPSAPGELPAAMPGTPEAAAEAAVTAPAQVGESAAPALEAGEEFTAAEGAAAATGNMWGAAGGGLGLVSGGFQFAQGAQRAFGANATEQDEWHGGLDMVGGTAGVVSGGLGLAASGALGAGAAAAAAPIAAVAAPVAAAIGLGVAGDHQAEDIGLFGKGDDGKYQGGLEWGWNAGQHAGDAVSDALGGGTLGTAAGAITAGLATPVTEVAGAAADVGLGFDALGASSGMFGVGKREDGHTYNMGAFQAMDQLATDAGHGMDDLLGIDQSSTAGKVVSGITEGAIDIAEAPVALAADVGGALVGGAEAIGGWIGDLF